MLVQFDEWKGRAKSIAAVVLMLSVVWPVVEVALAVHRFRADHARLADKAIRIAENLETVTANLKEASLHAKTSAQHFNDVFEIEANLLKQPGTQESIGLFFRSGDDAARLMDKFNRLVDKTTTTVDHFNTKTHQLKSSNKWLAPGRRTASNIIDNSGNNHQTPELHPPTSEPRTPDRRAVQYAIAPRTGRHSICPAQP